MPPDHICQKEEEGRPVCSREMKGTEGEWEKIARQKGEAAWISPSCFLLFLPLLGFTGFTAVLTLTKLWFETHSSRRTHSLSVKFGKANLISFFREREKKKLQCYKYNQGTWCVLGEQSQQMHGFNIHSQHPRGRPPAVSPQQTVPWSLQSTTLTSCQHLHRQPWMMGAP